MKLVWLFGMVVLAFVGLGIRITVINASLQLIAVIMTIIPTSWKIL